MQSESVVSAFVDAVRLTLTDRLESTNTHVGWLHQIVEFLNHPHKFQEAYDLLQDEHSKEIYRWLIRFRTSAYLTQSTEESLRLIPPLMSRQQWKSLEEKASRLPEAALKGHLGVDLVENFVLDGYRLPGICEVSAGDTVLDLGAFNGNSSIQFARRAGSSGKVYAFEPNAITRDTLADNLLAAETPTVEIVPCGVSDRLGAARFIQAGAASRFDPAGTVEIKTTTIDAFVAERAISRLHFLKLDIEGHELVALRGAAATIRECRPKIAVCIYHLHYDMHAIQLFLRDICPWYRFYLRHNYTTDAEVVLFCEPITR